MLMRKLANRLEVMNDDKVIKATMKVAAEGALLGFAILGAGQMAVNVYTLVERNLKN